MQAEQLVERVSDDFEGAIQVEGLGGVEGPHLVWCVEYEVPCGVDCNILLEEIFRYEVSGHIKRQIFRVCWAVGLPGTVGYTGEVCRLGTAGTRYIVEPVADRLIYNGSCL